MNKVLNIFVAGSKSLERERNHFKIEAQNLQAEYEQHKNKHIQINVYTFESFSSISDNTETPQDRYNHYIINEADIVFFVFDGEVGGITIQEFNVAENAYKHSKDKRPQLCIFAREGAKDSVEIKYLKKRVTDLKQYWIDYKDDGDFRYKIKKARRKKRLCPCFAVPCHEIISAVIFSFLMYNKGLMPPHPLCYAHHLSYCGSVTPRCCSSRNKLIHHCDL